MSGWLYAMCVGMLSISYHRSTDFTESFQNFVSLDSIVSMTVSPLLNITVFWSFFLS